MVIISGLEYRCGQAPLIFKIDEKCQYEQLKIRRRSHSSTHKGEERPWSTIKGLIPRTTDLHKATAAAAAAKKKSVPLSSIAFDIYERIKHALPSLPFCTAKFFLFSFFHSFIHSDTTTTTQKKGKSNHLNQSSYSHVNQHNISKLHMRSI